MLLTGTSNFTFDSVPHELVAAVKNCTDSNCEVHFISNVYVKVGNFVSLLKLFLTVLAFNASFIF